MCCVDKCAVDWRARSWWGEPVCLFLRCLEVHAADHALDEDTPYWVCAYGTFAVGSLALLRLALLCLALLRLALPCLALPCHSAPHPTLPD